MAITITDPGLTAYPISDWEGGPFIGAKIHYEKFFYDEEPLEEIAKRHGLTWQDLAFANWGTDNIGHVNWYLSKRHPMVSTLPHPELKTKIDGQDTFKLLKIDEPNYLWVPKDRKITSENRKKLRPPSPYAIGHVAPADALGFPDHVNTLAFQPVYEISLELGDLDALFDSMDGGGTVAHKKGVQQRLQVLGFFYQPMGLSAGRRNRAGEVSWAYYKKIHTWKAVPQGTTDKTYTVNKTSIAKNGMFNADMVGNEVSFTSKTSSVNGEKRTITAATAGSITFAEVADLKEGDSFKIDIERTMVPTDAQAKRFLRFEVRNNVLAMLTDNTRFPESGDILDGRLPRGTACAGVNDRATDEFGMIRIPGGYYYNWPRPGDRITLTRQDAPDATDADAKYDVKMYSERYAFETLFYEDNDFLGRIPLVATVKRINRNGKRELVAGVSVYFQIVTPDLPVNNELRGPALRRVEMDRSKDWEAPDPLPYTLGDTNPANAPTKGPAKLIHDTMEAIKSRLGDDTDPQNLNAPHEYGGRRGLPVHGNGTKEGVFEIDKARKGLHSKRDAQHPDYGKIGPAQKVPDDLKAEHPHAVFAKTSDEGVAGVIFMPSRLGGDTYRLRAYIGPETLGFKGDNKDGPVVETGTMTVWRNIRLCGYHRRKRPESSPGVSSASMTVKNVFRTATNGRDARDVDTFDWSVNRTSPAADMYDAALAHNRVHTWPPNAKTSGDNYRPVTVNFPSLIDAFRPAYCEVITDVSSPKEMTNADFRGAIQKMRVAARDCGEVTKTLDWNYLLLDDPTSPWMVTLRSAKDYNDGRPDKVGFRDLLRRTRPAFDDQIFIEIGMLALAEQFTEGGYLPGLTIIHLSDDINGSYVYKRWGESWGAGGFGGANGAFFLIQDYKSSDDYDVPIEGTVVHEGGHCLFHVHAPHVAGGAEPSVHQLEADCKCVMDYMGCYGDFCGRCLLKLRGWKIQTSGAASAVDTRARGA